MNSPVLPTFARVVRLLGLGLVVLFTAACAAPDTKPEVVVPEPESKPQMPAIPPQPVYASFEKGTVYDLLVAEFAGRRGQFGLATSKYLDLVKRTSDTGIAERATHIALFSKDDAASIDAAGEWARLDDSNVDALGVYAALLLRQNRTEEALAQFKRMIVLRKDEPRVAYARIVELLGREQNRQTSFAVMEALVEDQSGDANARFALAQLAARAGQMDKAIAELTQVRKLAPADERSADLLARVLQSKNQPEQALAVLSDFLGREPDAHTIRMSYGRLLVGENQIEAARDQFARVVKALPENADSRYAYAIVLMQLEQNDDAKREFSELVQGGRRQYASWYYLGQLAELSGENDEALRAYSRVDRGEFRLNAQMRAALLLGRQGDITSARASLQSLRRYYTSQRVRLYRAEADILVEAERLDLAVEVYSEALAEMPGNTDLLYARAMVAARTDDVVSLERDLRAILAVEPDNADALNALGYTLADLTDRHEEALKLIERALELKPDEHYVVDSMGWVLYRLGRLGEAEKYLRQALSLRDDAEVAAHLGEVLWAMGRRDEARDIWSRALEKEPDSEPVRETINRLDAD